MTVFVFMSTSPKENSPTIAMMIELQMMNPAHNLTTSKKTNPRMIE